MLKKVVMLSIPYAIGGALAWAGSQNSGTISPDAVNGVFRAVGLTPPEALTQLTAGAPIFATCAATAFVIQWFGYVPAYIFQTERYYDLIGAITNSGCTLLAAYLVSKSGENTGKEQSIIPGFNLDLRSTILASCVVAWAVRLGSFLFTRILQDGHDTRFEKIKPNPLRFFFAWSLQGLWVLIGTGAALASISASKTSGRDKLEFGQAPLDYVGLALYVFGILFETIADRQKRAFRTQNGSGKFINTGLWAYSRHPNYFGEIALWFGVAMMAWAGTEGAQRATMISPLFSAFLLTKVSGIPMLEAKSDKKWAGNKEYELYKKMTPVLIPFLRWGK